MTDLGEVVINFWAVVSVAAGVAQSAVWLLAVKSQDLRGKVGDCFILETGCQRGEDSLRSKGWLPQQSVGKSF